MYITHASMAMQSQHSAPTALDARAHLRQRIYGCSSKMSLRPALDGIQTIWRYRPRSKPDAPIWPGHSLGIAEGRWPRGEKICGGSAVNPASEISTALQKQHHAASLPPHSCTPCRRRASSAPTSDACPT
ncbi:uncharacterized protein PAN0_014c5017 [Moesziomyces antarcticus]|uniref:Uncharacterized protein n=1 Tax=Pseudozyma antarctica TaxID=84753 RepID=A0A081CJE7_PSEA2|nr:uncharacterized protein PAN0_014c5017 [Moesziomyces antarcticus]GAK66793.1 hypothetical protein PAN0_014c5017 [Moesziomyces antarcticus]